MSERSEDGMLVFGPGCPQHPAESIVSVEWEPARAGGVLVTARYGCGHRHTQYSGSVPRAVRDTAMRLHRVAPAGE